MYANEAGLITAADMTNVLHKSNKSASWFGDPAMSKPDIEQLVAEVSHQAETNI